MFELVNKSPFAAILLPLLEADGGEAVMVVVKGTYRIDTGERPRLAEPQPAPRLTDEYFAEPGASSLRYAGDVVPDKRGTDVALVGSVYAPRGLAKTVDVSLSAGPLRKTVRVFGDRFWRGFGGTPSISDPAPFSTMPLIYENAFGGVDNAASDPRHAESWNPVGKGIGLDPVRREIALPNLEAPEAPIRSARDRPRPAGFGFVAPSWGPRLAFAGTYDDAWKSRRFPLLPEDFDPRFYNAGHPELVSKQFFRGGEAIRVLNASRGGSLAFYLPAVTVRVDFYINGTVKQEVCNLNTVLIEPDEARLQLTWRASVRCHRKIMYVTGAKVRVDGEGVS